MKYLVLAVLLIISSISKSQLVYLGDDDIQKSKKDGYVSLLKTTGMVTLDGKYYFSTPNGRVYETDGSESNTKVLKEFAPQNLPSLQATSKYIYFLYNGIGEDVKSLARYSPSTGVNLVNAGYNNISINCIKVPGGTTLVDELFTNYDKDALLLRTFKNDRFNIYTLSDFNSKPDADIVAGYDLNMRDISTPIDIGTEIETFKNEVYWNGRVKPTGVYETSTYIYKPTQNNARTYEFKTQFSLLKYKLFPYFRFLRTQKNIFSLVKEVDSIGGFKHLLYYYDESQMKSGSYDLRPQATDYDSQKIDDEIYVSCKGYLWRFIEKTTEFVEMIGDNKTTNSWDNVQKNKRFLKVNNYYLYRSNGKLWVYSATSKKTKEISNEVLPKINNQFTLFDTYAYAGKNAFYFTQKINDKEVFTKYSPATETYTPIEFPAFKRQDFEEIKNISQINDKFVFLTSYKGKKDKPVYKMFMYTEEATTETTTPLIIKTPTITIVDKPIDVKLFTKQFINIIGNAANKFENIKGEAIEGGFGIEDRSTQPLEGFADEKIINYSSSSYLYRYQAETGLFSKADADKKINQFDELIKAMKLPFTFTRTIDIEMKIRKIIRYDFNGKMATVYLDLSTDANDLNDDTKFKISIRADKSSRGF